MLDSILPKGSSLIQKKYHNLRFLIKVKLLEKDWNMADLSREAGIPYNTLYGFMVGTKQQVKLMTFMKIIRVLDNLSLEEIINSEL